MKLQAYLKENGLTQGEFAERIGVCTQAVQRYAKKGRVPEPDIVVKIHSITGGLVGPADWYEVTNGQ